jgi:hypothetical protein
MFEITLKKDQIEILKQKFLSEDFNIENSKEETDLINLCLGPSCTKFCEYLEWMNKKYQTTR